MPLLTPRLAAFIGENMSLCVPEGCTWIVTVIAENGQCENVSPMGPQEVRKAFQQLGEQPVGEVDIAYGR